MNLWNIISHGIIEYNIPKLLSLIKAKNEQIFEYFRNDRLGGKIYLDEE